MDKHIRFNLLNLQGYYLFSFFALGSLTPLLSVYLSEVEKLNGYQIGTIMSVGPVIMIVFQPLWGMFCDWTGKPTKILSITTLLAGVFALGYLFFDQYYLILGVAVLFGIFQSAMIPVSDSISLQYTSKVKANYGNIRLFGSLGFGIAVFIMGRLSETDLGPTVIFYATFIALTIGSLLALRLPKENESAKLKITHGIKELFRIKRFLIFLAVTFLIFGPNLANNVYYGLFVEARGGTYTGIGIAFLLAVLSEIPFMRIAGSWIRKLGLLPIALIAGIASLVRWIFYVTQPGLEIIYATSIIQGFSLGLFIPAGLQYIRRITPQHITVTAVTVYSAIGNGLGNWFSTFTGGIILEKMDIYSVYLFFGILSLMGILLTLWLIKMEKDFHWIP
ncbi:MULTISPECIES: MFS transporter [unclassified Bacillus (in: firmicutes)]|uniref:MFS transporter n=1 Tax=unclassified Bacillus (in: firmicutes) TaxID=185979 RepID=UPI000E3C5D46|nr:MULTISPECIES: MFS transporter [unclassified Bacillus (in: firmicutes)]RFU68239.1 MFS transporter [Bacillus sp. V59.32b]CAH0347149.1 putative 3-phenylpropionic acid transporter [Bacillus sp. CECT 9360]